MIKAYVYLTESILNIGSCKDGLDIYEVVFGDQMRETGDHAYFELQVLPRIGDNFEITGVLPLELEVVDIKHTISRNFPGQHSCRILFKQIHLTDWDNSL